MIALLSLAACAPPPEVPATRADVPAVSDSQGPPLTAVQQLVRASMSLRGVRPSRDDLEAVEADPEALRAVVAGYVDDPRFGTVVRDLHDETLQLIRTGEKIPATGPLADVEMTRLQTSALEGPLRLVEHVVTTDRPYTEILTADYALTNDVTARMWQGLEDYDFDAGPEWQVVQWSDGRPAAGILADHGLWLRWGSPNENKNRKRANLVTRALLCFDFLALDIAVDGSIDLADPEALADALAEDPTCTACHAVLDPLASFVSFEENWSWQDKVWPDRILVDADFWREMNGVPPAYFGTPGDDLGDLASSIAADPQFASCTARRFTSYFGQVPLDDVDPDVVRELADTLVASDWSGKELAIAAALHPSVQTQALLRTRPEQLASLIEDLTGYRWETWIADPCCGRHASAIGHTDLLRDAYVGYRALGGGLDDDFKTEPTRTLDATTALVLRRLAAEAAAFVVERDLGGEVEPKLLGVGADDTDEASVRQALVDLHWRLYGERVDPAEVDDALGVWTAVLEGDGDVRHAWRVVLTAMLQDVAIATY